MYVLSSEVMKYPGTFIWAYEQMEAGKSVCRAIWPSDWRISLPFPSGDGGILFTLQKGRMEAFSPNPDDFHATDWEIAA